MYFHTDETYAGERYEDEHAKCVRWLPQLVPGNRYVLSGTSRMLEEEKPLRAGFTPVSGPFWATTESGDREVHIAVAEGPVYYLPLEGEDPTPAVQAFAVPLSLLGIRIPGEPAPQPSGYYTKRVP